MPRFSTQLSGSHVLVTGGTKGIGRSMVEIFLSEGANVSCCARKVSDDDFVRFEDAADGARAVRTSVDISDASSIEAWVNKSAVEFGRIDVAVPNAESWTKSFQADVMGLVALIEAAAPHLEKRGGIASIVVVSSLAGFEARHSSIGGPYTALKRAQAVLAKDYAHKLEPLGVRINTIVPGAIETPNITLPDGTEELSIFKKVKRDQPDYYKTLLGSIPLGRTGCVDDVANVANVANVVVFLGSHLSSYVAGANIFVDGSMSTAF